MIYSTTDDQTGITEPSKTKFSLGQLVATPGAVAAITQKEIEEALQRHQSGDWGDLEPDDKHVNERSLAEGFRLFSSYHSAQGTKFWIITGHDRSVTTVLLPEEY